MILTCRCGQTLDLREDTTRWTRIKPWSYSVKTKRGTWYTGEYRYCTNCASEIAYYYTEPQPGDRFVCEGIIRIIPIEYDARRKVTDIIEVMLERENSNGLL